MKNQITSSNIIWREGLLSALQAEEQKKVFSEINLAIYDGQSRKILTSAGEVCVLYRYNMQISWIEVC